MKKLSISKINRLSIPEFQQYMQSVDQLYSDFGSLATPIEESFKRFTEVSIVEGEVVQTKTKHDLTGDLDQLEEKRTKALMGLKKAIESLVYDEREEVTSDAKALLANYDFHIGNYNKLKIRKKSGKVHSFLNSFKEKVSLNEALERLGLRERITTLTEVNKSFFDMYLNRIRSRRQLKQNAALRAEMLTRFQSLLLDTEAYQRISPDDRYKVLLNDLEGLHLQYTSSNNGKEKDNSKAEDSDINFPPDTIEDMGSSTF